MHKTLDIAIPVYSGNLHQIPRAIKVLKQYFSKNFKDFDWKITIAINGRNADAVVALAKKLSDKNVRYTYTPVPGKGSGIMYAWSHSRAKYVAYVDVDIATRMNSFREMINSLSQFPVSIGSRYHKNSKVKRSFKRLFISQVYHKIFLRYFLGVRSFSDAQCGFKAIRRNVFMKVYPLIKNKNWFFDSEMLYLLEKEGFDIHEVPVVWEEDGFSSLRLRKTIIEFLKDMWALRFRKISKANKRN